MSKASSGVVSQVKGKHLIVQELADELVIFNRNTNTAHLLNPQATAVYRAAEDGCSIEDAARLLDGESEEHKRALATLAVADLATAGVVDSALPPLSRRSLLRTLGASVAAPMVISILAPSPAAAASNLPDGANCVFGVDTCATPGRVCVQGAEARCCVAGQSDTSLDGTEVAGDATVCCSGVVSGSVCFGN